MIVNGGSCSSEEDWFDVLRKESLCLFGGNSSFCLIPLSIRLCVKLGNGYERRSWSMYLTVVSQTLPV